MLQQHCTENLISLQVLLRSLNEQEYQQKCPSVFGASIGQHYRHILEFYQVLLSGFNNGRVNYDLRNRNTSLETSISAAEEAIVSICTQLQEINYNSALILEGNYNNEKEGEAYSLRVESNIYRELLYCLDHSIHHQALIKVALQSLGLLHLAEEGFGVAPATIRHIHQEQLPKNA